MAGAQGSGGGAGGGVVVRTVAHPDFLKTDDCGAAGCVANRVAHPCFLTSGITPSTSMLELATRSEGAAAVGGTGGFGIRIPLAAAIFLNSFSSRRRSFSLRFSASSLSLRRTLACMSRKRAL